MAKENETVADIIAWLRRPREGENGYLTAWRDEIADRVEAAYKRKEWTHKKELKTRDAVIQTEAAAREAEREVHKREIDELKNQVAAAAFHWGLCVLQLVNKGEK